MAMAGTLSRTPSSMQASRCRSSACTPPGPRRPALAKRGWQVEYVAVRRQADLGIPAKDERKLVVLAAARLGKTRLIDNFEVCL